MYSMGQTHVASIAPLTQPAAIGSKWDLFSLGIGVFVLLLLYKFLLKQLLEVVLYETFLACKRVIEEWREMSSDGWVMPG